MNTKKRKSEHIISILLETGGNIGESATKAEISETTLWRYLKDPEFLKKYREAKGRILELTLGRVSGYCADSLKTLHTIAEDTKATDSARVSACRTILELAIRCQEIEVLATRIDALEEMMK